MVGLPLVVGAGAPWLPLTRVPRVEIFLVAILRLSTEHIEWLLSVTLSGRSFRRA